MTCAGYKKKKVEIILPCICTKSKRTWDSSTGGVLNHDCRGTEFESWRIAVRWSVGPHVTSATVVLMVSVTVRSVEITMEMHFSFA